MGCQFFLWYKLHVVHTVHTTTAWESLPDLHVHIRALLPLPTFFLPVYHHHHHHHPSLHLVGVGTEELGESGRKKVREKSGQPPDGTFG